MREKLEVCQALKRGRELPYALIRSLSRVTLGPNPEKVGPAERTETCSCAPDGEPGIGPSVAGTELAELTEVRFFGPDEEVRIFRNETGLQAARFWEDAEDIVIKRRCRLANTPLFGRSITVHQFLSFDEEDGQAAICDTRLAGWDGGLPDGK